MKKRLALLSLALVVVLLLSSCGNNTKESKKDSKNTDTSSASFTEQNYEDANITELRFSVEKSPLSLYIGETETGWFKVKSKDDFKIEDIEFISSDTSVATFEYDKTALKTCIYYKIAAISEGTATVYAQTKDGVVKTSDISIVVRRKDNKDQQDTKSENSESDNSKLEVSQNKEDHIDETLNGRGHADSGREEPNYINVIGYAAVSLDQEINIKKNDDFQNESIWQIPTYKKDKQFWIETGEFIPHKTEVVVREQFLEHEGYGEYSGYLLIEKTDDKSTFFIDVMNFVTSQYWNSDDIEEAAKKGLIVAKYEQKSDYYPVTSSNEKVVIPKGKKVLVTGTTGLFGRNGPDSSTNQIEAMVWKEWKYGYGGVECYFNADDLTIEY